MREKERANKSEKRKLSRRAIPGGESRVATGGELHQTAGGAHPSLTTSQGVALSDNQNSLKANPQGPALLEDFILRDKITHFDHERIPERIVHARGTGICSFFALLIGLLVTSFGGSCGAKYALRHADSQRLTIK
jgi:catalase